MLTLCITVLLYSCTATKSSSDFSNEIFVDVEQSVELPLQRGRIIPLETSDSSLLYDIVSIDQVKDKYFIRSRNKILTFDTEGNYLYSRPLKSAHLRNIVRKQYPADFFNKPQKSPHGSFEVVCGGS